MERGGAMWKEAFSESHGWGRRGESLLQSRNTGMRRSGYTHWPSAHLAIHEFELGEDLLALCVSPFSEQINDGYFVSTCTDICTGTLEEQAYKARVHVCTHIHVCTSICSIMQVHVHVDTSSSL